MRKNLNIARNLGYIDVPERHARQAAGARRARARHEVMILCTGSQGEPMSALTRIAYNDHPSVSVERGDTVIISAKPVPGNELRVHDTINRLAKAGAEVLHQENAPVHVSGHACSEELRTLLALVRPQRGDADARRVPDARGARASSRARPASRRTRSCIAENGSVVELERGRRRGSSTGSRRASRSSTASASATSATSRCATAAASPRTAS